MKALLEIKDVAEELATLPIGVSRLIARGKLKAGRIGETGAWRVTRGDLDDYVRRGLPDFKRAKTGEGGLLELDTSLRGKVRLLENAILAKMEEQQKSLNEIAAMAKKINPFPPTMDVLVDPSPEINALLDQQPVKDVFVDQATFLSWKWSAMRQVFLASYLYRAIDSEATGANKRYRGGATEEKLYDSPEQYKTIVDAAVASVQQRRLGVPITYTWVENHDLDVPPQAPESFQVRAFYMLPFAKIFTPQVNTLSLADIAL
jgi:hypothetical protein